MSMYQIINYAENDFDVLHEGSTIENHGSIGAEEVLDWIDGHEDDTFVLGPGPELSADQARDYMRRHFGAFR